MHRQIYNFFFVAFEEQKVLLENQKLPQNSLNVIFKSWREYFNSYVIFMFIYFLNPLNLSQFYLN